MYDREVDVPRLVGHYRLTPSSSEIPPAAIVDAAAVFRSARSGAIYRRAPVAVIIDTLRSAVSARADSIVLLQRELGQGYGVRLTATRDSMAFDAHGLGVGVANLSLVARRGRFADTLFVSRLGRLRY